VVLFVSAPASLAGPRRQHEPINPAFLKYRQQIKAGTLSAAPGSGLLAAAGHGLGLVPATVEIPSFSAAPFAQIMADALPLSYDLRTASKVTSVKNQGAYGTCWTFATMGSLESSLMPSQVWDLSEDNIARTAGFDFDPYNGGGNVGMSTACLARRGPVTEADDPYGDAATPVGLAPRLRLGEWAVVCSDSGDPKNQAADIAAIKDAIYNHGAVFTSMCWTNSSYRSATASYYGGSVTYAGTGHAVTIVGWDDDYSKANFSPNPVNNGAWIVKNSWGSAWGSSGYFYLSYDDYWAERSASYLSALPVGNYSRVYEYDPLGWVTSFNYGIGAMTAWFANDFTSVAAERLTAVGFYTVQPSVQYTIYTSSTHSGTRAQAASGTAALPGYHVVQLTTPLDLADPQAFSVIVRLVGTTGNYVSVPEESVRAGYSSAATSAAGQSFSSRDGTTWYDEGDPANGEYAGNVCVKAFTRPAASDTIAPVTTASGVPATGTWSRTSVTVGFTATDTGGWGVLYTQAGVDGAALKQCSSVTVQGDGTHTVSYGSVDKAGNPGTTKSATVKIDGTAPVTTDNHLTASLVTPATITLTPTDTTSGVATTEYKVDSAATFSTGTSVSLPITGSHTVMYRSTDAAGNVESTKGLTVVITSAVKPTSSSSYSFAASATAGWRTSAQIVPISLSSAGGTGPVIHYSVNGGSSWQAVSGTSASVRVTGDGSHHILFYASDSNGEETHHDAGYVNIDSQGPTSVVYPVKVKKGKLAILRFMIKDPAPSCGLAQPVLTIVKGRRVKFRAAIAQCSTNSAMKYQWRCRLPSGKYSIRLSAVDKAGNQQVRTGTATLLVR
jgi:C1A family cysteine protease